ncbi:hypothetical protein K438DRAFT_1982222 [Mycena galopus ATCC 62051]|nr:hypothetical protein K438DRAFT_1982222 [Mycena galopus ATCC 62051]
MSFVLRGLCAVRRQHPNLPMGSQALANMQMQWLKGTTKLDPTVSNVWNAIEPILHKKRVNFQRLPMAREHAQFTDAYHGLTTMAAILDKKHGQQVLEHGTKSWTLIGQHTSSLVAASMICWAAKRAYSVSAPNVVNISRTTAAPGFPGCREMAANIAGRGGSKDAIQEHRRAGLLSAFPGLGDWSAPLEEISNPRQRLGHCAETPPWIKHAPRLQQGGTLFSLAMRVEDFAHLTPTILGAWERLLLCATEEEFLKQFLATKSTMRMCKNCSGVAEELRTHYGAVIVDAAPYFERKQIQELQALTLSNSSTPFKPFKR